MLNDEEFAEFVQTRGPALLRTACFLSGSPQEGEDLLQQTLVNAYASFRRIRSQQRWRVRPDDDGPGLHIGWSQALA